MVLRLGLLAALCWGGVAVANDQAADAKPPVTERFADSTDETPSFQRHVVPLFGRLGCNGRACHGSFQGKGGFRLSLFGYDFQADHQALLDEESPRVEPGQADESLIVLKPTLDIDHDGGKRYELGSWEHHLIQQWIDKGAEYSGQEDKLVELRITPDEIVFAAAGQQQQLQVVAVWEDGTREDVTPLCRFRSNNDQIAAIDENGQVTGNEPGDSHIVVFYDKAVVPIPVMRPVSELTADKYPGVPTPTPIDELVVQKLRKMGIVPSEVADDATFLRRLSLDLTGTLPSAADVEAFLTDTSADKRARKIDELLETKAYAAWWTTKLCDFTGNNDQQVVNASPMRGGASQEWYDWIYQRVEDNTPYDQLVEGIVTARSREPSQSYREYCEQMSEFYRDDHSFAELPSMPHYWARRDFRNPPERAISFAYAFLGIRIQCAQCHKHPFDQWSKEDFEKFTGFFAYARAANNGVSQEDRQQYQEIVKELGLEGRRLNQARREFPKMIREGKTVPFPEVYVNRARRESSRNDSRRGRNRRGGNQPTKAKLLGGEEVALADYEDARQPLMDWLRQTDNPLFARALVNRVWANYFNVGIVEPPDDLSLANPPSNRALLDYLAEGFVREGYDMKWLHRQILNSRTYQLHWRPNETNRRDQRNFSHAVPRRLPAEVAYDALAQATAADKVAAEACNALDGRAIAIPGAGRRGGNNGPAYALQVFGRSTRESNCDCDRSMDATLLQTVFLRNDRDTISLMARRGTGWLDQVARTLGRRSPAAGNDNDNRSLRRRLAQLERGRDGLKKRLEQAVKSENEGQQQTVRQRLERLERQIRGVRRQIARAGRDVEEPKPADAAPDNRQDKPATDALVKQAYLRTLSRYPDDQELARSVAFVDESQDQVEGLEGVLWALINTKEFIVNH